MLFYFFLMKIKLFNIYFEYGFEIVVREYVFRRREESYM